MSPLPQSDPQLPDQTGSTGAPAPVDDAAIETAAPFVFPGVRDRLARAWDRYRSKTGTFLLLSLLALLLPAIVVGIVLAAAFGAVIAAIAARRIGASVGITLAGGVAAISLAGLFVQSSIAAAAAFKIRTGRALKVGLANLFPIAIALLFTSLVIVLPQIIVVPAIILGLRFLLVIPVVTTERRRGIEALARSRDLVYGKTFKLFAELLGIGIVVGIIDLLLRGGMGFATGLLAPITPFGPELDARKLIAAAPSTLLDVLFFPFAAIYLQVFYEDCVALKGQDWVMHPKRARLYGILAALGGLLTALAVAALVLLPTMLPKAPIAPPTSQEKQEEKIEDNRTVFDTAPPPVAPEERDLARYGDVNTVKIALSTYQSENKAYPDSLEALTPKYLSTVPADPLTKAPYGYVTVGLSYKLSFILESGVFALSKGEHYLTPNGFDVEPIQVPPPPPEGETTVTTLPAPAPEPAPEPPPEPENPLPDEPVPPTEGQPPAPTDADADGLADDDERARGTDPASSDSDKDGISDGEEVNAYSTDPLKADTDGDGYSDTDEIYGGFNPNGTGRLPDGDVDGLADIYESQHGFDPADKDMDNDGLSDGDELRVYGTDHLKADTDGDGFTDPQELQRSFEPNGPGLLSPERKSQIDADSKKYGLY